MSKEMDFAQLVAQEDEIKILMAKRAELEAELSTWIQAVGIASTLKPDMMIDVSDPIGMMQKVMGHVEQLERALAEAISAIHRLSEGQPFDAVVIADTVKRRTIQLEAELETERMRVKVLRAERNQARVHVDSAVKLLTGIYSCIYPPAVKLEDGCLMVFKPKNPHEYLQALSDHIRALPDEMVAHEVLNGGWVSFDMAQPEGPNLVQQYLGDSVLNQQNPPFWAFPTSRWRGAKELYATHWRYVQGPHE